MEEEKFQQKYRTKSFRRLFWDYGSHGLYFITICTHERNHYFGEIEQQNSESPLLQEKEIATIAKQNWLTIPQYHNYIELDEFVIMPNHIHGILFVNKPGKTTWNLNQFGAQSQNIASVIRGYKASVKKYATLNKIDFAWQSKYHDRVIRDENEYQNIRNYIYNNPANWASDTENIHHP
ncbi:transposase [Mucilaginibacter terrae]|uniref:transposase n=1 Tax=Mucilaginibacter terrae TaxID=1955052 RepID=UPI003630124E